jgi:hypothetical protein
VRKRQGFNQFNPQAPVVRPGNPFEFAADVNAASSTALLRASIFIPDGSSHELSWGIRQYHVPTFSFGATFASSPGLDAAYANGTYTLVLHGAHDGFRTIPLELPTEAYPPAPWVSNFSAAQNLDSGSDFLLEWAAFVGGTASDAIRVEIWTQDNPGSLVFASPDKPVFDEKSTALLPGSWTRVPGEIAATPPVNVFSVPLVGSENAAFYRIAVMR